MNTKELIEKIESMALIDINQIKTMIINDTLKNYIEDALLISDINQAIEKRETALQQNWHDSEQKFKTKYQNQKDKKPFPKKDIDLLPNEISERITSINKQIEKLEKIKSKDFNAKHEKIRRLIERKNKLKSKIN